MIIKIDEKEKYESYLLYFLTIRKQIYENRDSAIKYFWLAYAASENKKEIIDEIKGYGIDDPMKALCYFDPKREYLAYHKLPKRKIFPLLLLIYIISNFFSCEIGQFLKTNNFESAIEKINTESEVDIKDAKDDIPWFFCKTDTIYTKYKADCPTYLHNEYGHTVYGKFKYEQEISIEKHAGDVCNEYIIYDLINNYHAKNVIPKNIEITESGITNGVYLTYIDTLPNGTLTENTNFSECMPISDSTYKSLLSKYKISKSIGYNSYISMDSYDNMNGFIFMDYYKIIK